MSCMTEGGACVCMTEGEACVCMTEGEACVCMTEDEACVCMTEDETCVLYNNNNIDELSCVQVTLNTASSLPEWRPCSAICWTTPRLRTGRLTGPLTASR